jgi:hypothetical protein
MPGEGGVCGVVAEAGLLVLVVFAAGVLAGVVETVLAATLLGAAGAGVAAGLAVVVAGIVFAEVEVVAGFAIVAVLLVDVDLPVVAEEELPVVDFVDLEVFDFEVLLVELELVEELEPLPVLCANSAAEPIVPISRAPSTRAAISFLA